MIEQFFFSYKIEQLIMQEEAKNEGTNTKSKGIFSDNYLNLGGGAYNSPPYPPAGYPPQHGSSYSQHGLSYAQHGSSYPQHGYAPPPPPPTTYPSYGYPQPSYPSSPPPPVQAYPYNYGHGKLINCCMQISF